MNRVGLFNFRALFSHPTVNLVVSAKMHAEGSPMVKVKQSKRIVGAQALADEIGITRFHLYKVVNGIRHPSQRVKAELDLRGIKCKPCRLPTNV